MSEDDATQGPKGEPEASSTESALDDATEHTDAEEKHELVDLPSGLELDDAEASNITRAAYTPVILLAGERDSGKTTLLASIYDRLHEGEFGGYIFAGSKTLVAFEERCFLARVASGGAEPDTIRTPLGAGHHFLHLRLRDAALVNRARDFLIADMSGEYYRMATDSADECRQLTMLTRADAFVLLIDGARLAALEERHLCLTSAHQLLRRCVEQRMFREDTKIYLVYSKWDQVLCQEDLADELKPITSRFKQDIEALLSRDGQRIGAFHVAASPKLLPELGVGYGIDVLLGDWIGAIGQVEPEHIGMKNVPSVAAREFDRYRRV